MKHFMACIAVMAAWNFGDALAQSPSPGPSTMANNVTGSSILHLPYNTAIAGDPLDLVAVVDGPWLDAELVVRYRHVTTSSEFQEVPFERSPSGELYATIPGQAMQLPAVEYYIISRLQSGETVQHFASMLTPHRVAVDISFEEEWTRAQAHRLQGYMSSMRVMAEVLDFHKDEEKSDYFVRGEIEWTHHFLKTLHAVTAGFGFLDGKTPDLISPEQGYHYGYGSMNLRLHPSFWVDGRVMLGVDNDEFTLGGRIALTIGKPWDASVNLGGEHIGRLGSSAWLRLQLGTVPRVLMGATVMKTGLPDAAGSIEGSAITYDISWQASARMAVLASLSLAARGGGANLGGGLGAAWAF